MERRPPAKPSDLGRVRHFRPVRLMSPAGEVRRVPDLNLATRLLEAATKASRGERLRVRIGRRHVAIVPVEDLLRLERIEDEEDLRDLRAALAEAKREGTIPWDVVKASLGLERGDHDTSAPPERTRNESALGEISVFHDAAARTLEGSCDAAHGTSTSGTACVPVAALARGRPVRVEKGGQVVGVLISDEDFALFRRLLEDDENRLDIEATREAPQEVGSVSLEELVDEPDL